MGLDGTQESIELLRRLVATPHIPMFVLPMTYGTPVDPIVVADSIAPIRSAAVDTSSVTHVTGFTGFTAFTDFTGFTGFTGVTLGNPSSLGAHTAALVSSTDSAKSR